MVAFLKLTPAIAKLFYRGRKYGSAACPFELDEHDSIVANHIFLNAIKSLRPEILGSPIQHVDGMGILAKPD